MKSEKYVREDFAECLRMELQRVLSSESGRGGIDAEAVSRKTLEAVRVRWGGDRIYLAQCSVSERAQRDAEILALVAVGNRSEAMQKHGISERRLREIVARDRLAKAGSDAGAAYRRLIEE